MGPPGGLPLIGRGLLIAGVALAVLGLLLMSGARFPWLGRLPGDFVFGRGPVRVYLPLGTSLLISVVLTLVLLGISLLRR